MKTLFVIPFVLFSLISSPSQSETITLAFDSEVRPTPCSTQSLTRVKKGTSLEMIESANAWSGAIRTIWYKVIVSEKKGWISNQNTTKPTKPIFDKSGIGKKCRWEEK